MKQVIYQDDKGYLCFKHAVHEATKGTNIKTLNLDDDKIYLCHICVYSGTTSEATPKGVIT